MEQEPLFIRKIPRREAITTGAKLAGAAAILPVVGFDAGTTIEASGISSSDNKDLDNIRHKSGNKLQEHQEEHAEPHKSSLVNDVTAYGTGGAFGFSVLSVALEGSVGKLKIGPKEFGKETVFIVGAFESARIAALAAFDKEALKHELTEHATAIPFAFILPIFAEAADNTKAFADTLFAEKRYDEEFSEAKVIEEIHMGEHVVKSLKDCDLGECEQYLGLNEEEVVRLVAGNAALTSVIAPITTTYVSSSASVSAYAPLTRGLIRYYYAKEVIEKKKKKETIEDKEILEHAKEKAVGAINGNAGYSKLSLALSANTAGMGIIGDPPFIVSGIVNAAESGVSSAAKNHVEVSARGLAFSEAAHIVASKAFLKKAGVDRAGFTRDFIWYQAKALSSFGSTVLRSDMRNAAYGGLSKQSEWLTDKLETLGHARAVGVGNVDKLSKYLRNIPKPLIEIDALKVANKLIRPFESRQKYEQLIDDAEAQKAVEEMQFVVDYVLSSGEGEPDIEEKMSRVRNLDQARRVKNIASLTNMLTDVLTSKKSKEDLREDIKEVAKNVDESAPNIMADKLGEIAEQEELSEDEVKQLENYLGILGNDDVKQGLKDALDVYRGVDKETHEEAYLGHSAKEVMYALLTQLPAVPSLVHLAEKWLPKTVGVEPGEPMTEDQLNQMVAAVLVSTSVISATADNVAAFFYGRRLLSDLFKEYYGEEEFNNRKEIKRYANNAALLSAVIGGSLSKVGNGPNFLIKRVEAEMDGYEMHVKVTEESVPLASSVVNPYAVAQVGAMLGWLYLEKQNDFKRLVVV